MIKKYKHISFDLDGTLVHTAPEYRYKIVPEVVEKLGGNIDNTHSIDRFWFESGRDVVIKNNFCLEPAVFWKLFRELDLPEKRGEFTFSYDDAEPAIRRLKELGKAVSIVTGAPHNIAEIEIKKLNGAPHDFYLSIADSKFGEKPEPESLHYVIEKLNHKPEETLYIGNSNEDAYYAKNADVDFIYLERKEHKFDLKDYTIATINSLTDLF